MSQNDTIGKNRIKSIFRLVQVTTLIVRMTFNSFLQLFDELRVNGDYH